MWSFVGESGDLRCYCKGVGVFGLRSGEFGVCGFGGV